MNNLYQEIVIDLAQNPPYYGKMADAEVVLHEHLASCGDQIWIYLKLNDSKTAITALSWESEGCVISRAAMSVVADKVHEFSFDATKIVHLSSANLEQTMGITDLSPGRIKCLLLGLNTLKNFIHSLQEKKVIG